MPNDEPRPSTPIEAVPGIGPRTGAAFRHLGIANVGDLLRHFPARYEHERSEMTVADVQAVCDAGESPATHRDWQWRQPQAEPELETRPGGAAAAAAGR